jgi:excisionase family DNA binding protein
MHIESKMAVPADEGAKLLGVPRSRIWDLIKQGQIASFKIGRRRMVATSELRRFIERKAAEAQV